MSACDPLAQFRRPDFTDDMRNKIMFPKVYRHKQLLFWKRLTKVLTLLLFLAVIVYFILNPPSTTTEPAANTQFDSTEASETAEQTFTFADPPQSQAD